jgi:hypothetical protein
MATATSKRKRKARVQTAAPLVPEPGDMDSSLERIVARPDGYHWIALDGKQEFGPFETIEAAQASMEAAPLAGAETLHDAERDIGIADWIDTETGEPAEGQSPPHLDEE